MTATVYVYLLDEGTDVWRPVRAERVTPDVYRISQQAYDTDTERWEFPPGSLVKVREKSFKDGSTGLVAYAEANG